MMAPSGAGGGYMTFRGNGVIWNPKKSRQLVNFRHVKMFDASDEYEIEILRFAGCEPVEDEQGAYSDLTKADLVKIAKESGIKGAAQMKKADILERLG